MDDLDILIAEREGVAERAIQNLIHNYVVALIDMLVSLKNDGLIKFKGAS